MTTHQNKTLAQLIVEWSAKRPDWQQEVLYKAARGEVVQESDYDQLIDKILNPGTPTTPLSVSDFPQTTALEPQVRLQSVANTEHVNALVSGEQLTFEVEGLTIVYGDNGSGKSGYAKLLKDIARARHKGEILTDVFNDTAQNKPSASISVEIGGKSKPLVWPNLELSDRLHLQRMLFYDSMCGVKYISVEAEIPYRPSELAVMETLVDICHKLQAHIDDKLNKNVTAIWQPPTVMTEMEGSELGKFLSRFSEDTPLEQLDLLIGELEKFLIKFDGQTETASSLRGQEASILKLKSQQSVVVRQIEKMNKLSKHLKETYRVLGDTSLKKLKERWDEFNVHKIASDLAAQEFASGHLSGVGGDSWKILWDSARQFSEKVAYLGQHFPVVSNNGRCVLCQQELSEKACKRFLKFEEFVKNDTQTKLNQARVKYQELADTIRKLNVLPNEIRSHMEDLKDTHKGLVEEVSEYIKKYQAVQNKTTDLINKNALVKLTVVEPTAILSKINKATTELKQLVADPESIQTKLAQTVIKRQEFELLQKLKKSKNEISNEIERLKKRRKLEAAKQKTITTSVTSEIRELLENLQDYNRAFESEIKQLQLDRVSLFVTRASKGKVMNKPQLVRTQQNAELPFVFSEGEQTILGLAALFTEVQLNSSNSALILDDPVNSLDHVRRRLVAKRLVEIAGSRQVIIFTHDVAFVRDLKLEASAGNVKIADRSVEQCMGDKKPGKCYDRHPWKARDVKNRIKFLEDELDRIKKEQGKWDGDTYEKEVSSWAGSLSETLERTVSQEIVDPVLAEGGLEVHPKMVRIFAEFTDDDYNEFDNSYSQVSLWAKRHDKNPKSNYVPPDIKCLEKELENVKAWFMRIKTYRNK